MESVKGVGDWKQFAQELGLTSDQILNFTESQRTNGDSPQLHQVAKSVGWWVGGEVEMNWGGGGAVYM